MAVSGSFTDFQPDVIDLIERAYARCQIDLTALSAEDAINAKAELNMLLLEWAADGPMLWTTESFIQALYPYVNRNELPAGTRDLLDVNYRIVTNVDSSEAASSAGGTIANAFDADVETVFTQTSANGRVTCTFSGDTPISVIGILPAVDADWTLTFQVSDDGTTWRDVYAPGATAFVDRRWQWWDIDNVQAAPFFRMVMSGGGTLSVRELVIGQPLQRVPLARMNRDQWEALPNLKQIGSVPTNFWFDRQRNTAYINTWPVMTTIYMHLIGKRQRRLYSVATFTEEVDVPEVWYRALADNLALALAEANPKRVDPKIKAELQMQAKRSMDYADEDERDNSPIEVDYGIGVYTQ